MEPGGSGLWRGLSDARIMEPVIFDALHAALTDLADAAALGESACPECPGIAKRSATTSTAHSPHSSRELPKSATTRHDAAPNGADPPDRTSAAADETRTDRGLKRESGQTSSAAGTHRALHA